MLQQQVSSLQNTVSSWTGNARRPDQRVCSRGRHSSSSYLPLPHLHLQPPWPHQHLKLNHSPLYKPASKSSPPSSRKSNPISRTPSTHDRDWMRRGRRMSWFVRYVVALSHLTLYPSLNAVFVFLRIRLVWTRTGVREALSKQHGV